MNTLLNYLKATKGELKHVAWPTQKQTIVFTTLVILISIFTSIYLGLFDFVFTYAVEQYILSI